MIKLLIKINIEIRKKKKLRVYCNGIYCKIFINNLFDDKKIDKKFTKQLKQTLQ